MPISVPDLFWGQQDHLCVSPAYWEEESARIERGLPAKLWAGVQL